MSEHAAHTVPLLYCDIALIKKCIMTLKHSFMRITLDICTLGIDRVALLR